MQQEPTSYHKTLHGAASPGLVQTWATQLANKEDEKTWGRRGEKPTFFLSSVREC